MITYGDVPPAQLGSAKAHAPAAERNRQPIAEVLATMLPKQGRVLEIASGTGQHAVHFARCFPQLAWQPTDADPAALASIRGWRAEAGLDNLLEPIALDVTEEPWPLDRADAIVCINMVHISPWGTTEGLMRGAGQLLANNGVLILYGPYRRQDVVTAPSNEAFDASLRARDPNWGLREVEAVTREANRNGLQFERLVEMPANNLTLLYRRC